LFELSGSAAAVAWDASAGHTCRMKTADALFHDVERLAKRLKKSRSKLYLEAVAEYAARHEPDAVTEALNRVVANLATRPDKFTTAAARRLLEHSKW
jgi:predicted transcriptional regulator